MTSVAALAPTDVTCGRCGGRAQILPFLSIEGRLPATKFQGVCLCLDGCSSDTPAKGIDFPGQAADMASAPPPAEGWCDCELCVARWGTP